MRIRRSSIAVTLKLQAYLKVKRAPAATMAWSKTGFIKIRISAEAGGTSRLLSASCGVRIRRTDCGAGRARLAPGCFWQGKWLHLWILEGRAGSAGARARCLRNF